jgi:hypothetical protein
MAGSLKQIRESTTIKSTARDKGLALTMRVVAYDNGMVEVDGAPINASPDYDAADCWLGAAEIVVGTLSELRRQAVKRRSSRIGNPEASRKTAHIFLDAVALHHRGDPIDDDARDDMTDLALQRLREVGSIRFVPSGGGRCWD